METFLICFTLFMVAAGIIGLTVLITGIILLFMS